MGWLGVAGAFVAGNDAGRAYNTFPKMGDDWIPEEMRQASLQPFYRNLFENTAIVQFDHRVLALSTASAIGVMLALARGRPDVWRALPSESKKAITATAGMVAVQVRHTTHTYIHTYIHKAGHCIRGWGAEAGGCAVDCCVGVSWHLDASALCAHGPSSRTSGTHTSKTSIQHSTGQALGLKKDSHGGEGVLVM